MSDFNKKTFKKRQVITLLISFCIAIIGVLSGVFSGIFEKKIPDDTTVESPNKSNSKKSSSYNSNSSSKFNDQEDSSQDGNNDYGDNLILSQYVNNDGSSYLLCYDDEERVHISIESPENIVIPNGVVKISDRAFYNCNGIIAVTIPNSVTSIARGAFEGCNDLEEIKLPFVGTSYGSGKPFGALFTNSSYDINTYVPSSLRKVTITGKQSVGDDAFEGCKNLTSITIFDEVTSIGSYAFYGCSGLQSVTLGDSVATISYGAFYGCSSLTSIHLPNSVTYIGDQAFYNCKNLTEITLGENVECIGYYAFYNCSSLEGIIIPNSVTFIGSEAFAGCSSLVAISLPFVGRSAEATTEDSTTLFGYIFGSNSYEGSKLTRQFYSYGAYQDYYIPSSLEIVVITGKKISYRAFNNCQGITSVFISDSVTSVGAYAFNGCSNLTIYCEATSEPIGWDSDWNYDECPVAWGVVWEE